MLRNNDTKFKEDFEFYKVLCNLARLKLKLSILKTFIQPKVIL